MTALGADRGIERVVYWGQPFFFGAAFILLSFADSSSPLSDLWRPLLASQLAVLVVLGALLLITRRYTVAALLTSSLLAVLANFTIPGLVVTAIVLWWGLVELLRRLQRGRHGSITGPTRIASGFSAALFLVGLASALIAAVPRATTHESLGFAGGADDTPNIYVLLLDGYPRADTLTDAFGFSNERFLERLESLGFSVSRYARSNYNKTWLTVASLLDARYVNALPEFSALPPRPTDQMRVMHDVIENGSVLDFLKAADYDIISIPSPTTSSDVLDGSEVRSTGHLTAFEVILASHSTLTRLMPGPILDMITADQRQNVDDQLSLLKQTASERADRPRLVITHVMSPHLPFILGQEPDYLDACFPHCDFWTTPLEQLDMKESEFGGRLAIQIARLNESVTLALEAVVTDDPSAVMIVMSDHGIRHHVEGWDEHFNTLFAARTPNRDVFSDEISPVNVFRRLLSAYFVADLPDLPYRAWRSDWDRPMILTSVE